MSATNATGGPPDPVQDPVGAAGNAASAAVDGLATAAQAAADGIATAVDMAGGFITDLIPFTIDAVVTLL